MGEEKNKTKKKRQRNTISLDAHHGFCIVDFARCLLRPVACCMCVRALHALRSRRWNKLTDGGG